MNTDGCNEGIGEAGNRRVGAWRREKRRWRQKDNEDRSRGNTRNMRKGITAKYTEYAKGETTNGHEEKDEDFNHGFQIAATKESEKRGIGVSERKSGKIVISRERT